MGRRGMTRNNSRGGRCAWCTPCECFEQLEARIVLSGAYYEWVGVETLPGYTAEYGEPDAIVGMSENGRFMWSEAASDRQDPSVPYLVSDGTMLYLQDIAELEDAEIGGINSFGTVFATGTSDDSMGRHFLLDLSGSRTRNYLDEQTLQAPAGFDLMTSEPWAVADSGVLLMEGAGTVQRVLWAIVGDRVERLWEGDPGSFWNAEGLYVDSNSRGVVVGYGRDSYGRGVPMMWSAADGVVDLRAAGYNSVGSVNDDGSVLVSSSQGSLVLLRDGVAETIEFAPNDDFDHRGGVGRPRGRSGSGTLIVRIGVGDPVYAETEDRVITTTGLAEIRFRHGFVRDIKITESGSVYAGANNGAGWYQPTDGLSFYRSSAGRPATIWSNGGTLEVLASFLDGRSLRFISESPDGVGAWDADWRRINLTTEEDDVGRDVMLNPRTGNGLLLIEYPGGWTSIGTREPEDGYAQDRVFPWMRELGDLVTGFFSNGSRPVVAGYELTSGELNLLYVVGSGRGETRVIGLSETHLAPYGQVTPGFVSYLDSFATPWGAMNIVGLDDAGDLHAVWWSPGLGSSVWTTSNLSAISGAPKLVGNITASATAWNGMQVFGTDERGNAIAIWWSPGSGGWRWSDLTELTGGEALEAGSLTGATTRWGAIELVGRTADDQVVTYWWAPGSGGWVYESITLRQVGDTPRIAGPVSMTVAGDGSHHIAGVSAEGEVIHLYWLSDGSDLWRGENLTLLAVG